MKFEFLIWISLIWNPGFSRIRLFSLYAADLAGIPPAQAGTPGHFLSGQASHRLKPGLPVISYPGYFFKAAVGCIRCTALLL
jgi:hypothetical protein